MHKTKIIKRQKGMDKIIVARNCSSLPTRAAKTTTTEVNAEQKHEMK